MYKLSSLRDVSDIQLAVQAEFLEKTGCIDNGSQEVLLEMPMP